MHNLMTWPGSRWIYILFCLFTFNTGSFVLTSQAETPTEKKSLHIKRIKKKRSARVQPISEIHQEKAAIERESDENDRAAEGEAKPAAEKPTPALDTQLASPENTLLPAPVDITPKVLSAHEKLPSPEANSATLSLEDCTRLALQGATDILKSQNDVNFNGAQLIQGYAQFLPNIDAQGTYALTHGNNYFTFTSPTAVSSQIKSLNISITSRLNIFSGFSDLANFKSALHRKDAADLSLTRAKQQIVLDTTQSFLQVVLDNEIVIIAKKNLLLSQERQKLLEEQTRVGVRNLADLFRQQAQTSADELFLMNSLNKERSDEILLLRKLRQDVAKSYRLLPPKILEGKRDPRFADETKLIEVGLDKRTDLKAAQHLADAGSWDVTRAQADFYPKLDLSFTGYSTGSVLQKQLVEGVDAIPAMQRSLTDQLSNQNYYTVGLVMTFNLFNRWTTRLNSAQYRRAADNLDIDAVDRRLQVEGEIRQAYGDYQTGLQLLESSKKGLDAAEKAYEVTQGRYEVGAANFVDLITAQTSLVQAESSRAQALIGFLLQEKTMEFAIGD